MPRSRFAQIEFACQGGGQFVVGQRLPVAVAAHHAGEQAVSTVDHPLPVAAQQIEERKGKGGGGAELQVNRRNRFESVIGGTGRPQAGDVLGRRGEDGGREALAVDDDAIRVGGELTHAAAQAHVGVPGLQPAAGRLGQQLTEIDARQQEVGVLPP